MAKSKKEIRSVKNAKKKAQKEYEAKVTKAVAKTSTLKDKWSYPPFEEWVWKSYDNSRILNVDDFIKQHASAQFYIGTDSQTKNNRCTLTTAIIAYHMRRGGTIAIHTQRVPKFPALRPKLIAEAMRSLATAWYVDPIIPEESKLIIHVDVNDNIQWESGKYRDELVGMIMAQGFALAIKPHAWGSSKVADRKCKGRV